jgi:endosialidase-like protein
MRIRSHALGLAALAGGLAIPGGLHAQSPAARLVFQGLTPCRVVDTRRAAAGALAAGETRAFHLVGSAADFAAQGGTAGGCGLPGFSGGAAQVQAVAVNLVAVQPAGAGNLRAWPGDAAMPEASVLNYALLPGLNLANGLPLAVRQDSEGGDLKVRAEGAGTHLVADVVGYYRAVTQVDGSGSGLDADALDGLDASAFSPADHDHDQRYWRLGGNEGTAAGGTFLGTIDDRPLELRVNGQTAVRLEPGGDIPVPNVLLGQAHSVAAGVHGAAVGGGHQNEVLDDYAYVASGAQNRATDAYAAVLSGLQNEASGDYALVGGGRENVASGYGAGVLGGTLNRAAGDNAVVAGGSGSSAAGDNAFAAGTGARADHPGAFVWADATDRLGVASTADNQFVVRAQAVWLGTHSAVSVPAGVFLNTSTGAHLTAGGAWTNASDAALKQDFAPVDAAALLEAVARLPVASWSYRAEGPAVRHLGPTAQDFRAAFGLGADDRSITTVDAAGVALAAIQELERRTRQVEELSREVRELRRLLEEIRARP